MKKEFAVLVLGILMISLLSVNLNFVLAEDGNETNETDDDLCMGPLVDADSDGYIGIDACGDEGEDCNDSDAEINPGATEICDNDVDENCDGDLECDEDDEDEDDDEDDEVCEDETEVCEDEDDEAEDDDDEDDDDEAEEEIDDNTEDEIKLMDKGLGAKIRLLQLQLAMEKRVLWMDAVIERLEANNKSTEDIDILNGMVEEMKLLIEEVEAAIDAVDTDTQQESVRKFIDIKRDAKDVVKRFREKVKSMLTEDEKNALRRRFNQLQKERINELRERLKNRIRELNSERAGKLREHIKKVNEEFLEKIKNGEINYEEIKERMKEYYESSSEKNKERLRIKIRNEHIRWEIAKKNAEDSAEAKILTRAAERLRERAEKLEEMGHKRASAALMGQVDLAKAKAFETRNRIETRTKTIKAATSATAGGTQ